MSAPVPAQAVRPHRKIDVVTPILAIARLTALEAVRGRLAWLIAGFAIGGCVLAVFAGELAITETQGFRSGLLGAWLRSCMVFTISAFVIASAVREIHDRGLDLMLSMPVPRGVYYAGKLTGSAGVSLLSAGACGLALVWFAPVPQAALWAASLSLELLIVTAMSLLCVLTFSQVTWALGTVIGFYLLSRSIAALQLMAHHPLSEPASAARQFVRTFFDALAFVLPDLDRFTVSEWLIHDTGTVADLGFAAIQAAIYVVLLCAAGLFDLYRKVL